MSCSSMPMERLPSSAAGAMIVVNGGAVSPADAMLSLPTRASSSGIETPSSRAARIVPIASESLAATMAVGGSSRSSSRRTDGCDQWDQAACAGQPQL